MDEAWRFVRPNESTIMTLDLTNVDLISLSKNRKWGEAIRNALDLIKQDLERNGTKGGWTPVGDDIFEVWSHEELSSGYRFTLEVLFTTE